MIIIDVDVVGNWYIFLEKEGVLFFFGVVVCLFFSGFDVCCVMFVWDIMDVCIFVRIELVFFGFNVLFEGNDVMFFDVIKIKDE